MATQGSTLYAGSVSKAAIYEISQGLGLQWANFVKTEILVDGKPRQLTRAEHAGNPIVANIKNPRDADFAGTPTVTIDGRQLSVVELMTKDDFDIDEWKGTFPDYQPSGLNVDLKANPKIAKVVFDLTMEAMLSQVNELHSLGDTGGGGALQWYDGFETLINADVDATEVGTPAVLTSSNILDRVYELRNAVAPRLRNKKNLVTFCSFADFDLYDVARRKTQTQMAETDLGANDKLIQSNGSKITLIPMIGLSKDFMFTTLADTTDASNLVQGVWNKGDLNTLKMYKSEEADQVHKIVMRFDLGVQYKSGKDIWYIDKA